jgi:hypothetical protein
VRSSDVSVVNGSSASVERVRRLTGHRAIGRREAESRSDRKMHVLRVTAIDGECQFGTRDRQRRGGHDDFDDQCDGAICRRPLPVGRT